MCVHVIAHKIGDMTQPLYANLARDLQTAIAAGRHRPGSFLRGEHELAEAHGVSRATVRAALTVLEREGFVERRRGAGTFVLEPRPPRGFGQSVLTTDQLIQYAQDTRRVVSNVDEVVVERDIAECMGIQAGTRWLRISSLRVDPERPARPICASEAYVVASLAEVRSHLSDETTALCDLLARHCGVSVHSIDQELQGGLVPDELAGVLRAKSGTPALRILRRYRDAAGWVFMSTLGIHPADRFAYRMKLDRSQPSG